MLTRSRILRRFWMTIHCWICTEESLCLEPFYSRIKINLDIFYTNYSIRLGPQSWCSEMNITSTVKRLWNIIKCWSNLFFNGLLARVICKMLQGGAGLISILRCGAEWKSVGEWWPESELVSKLVEKFRERKKFAPAFPRKPCIENFHVLLGGQLGDGECPFLDIKGSFEKWIWSFSWWKIVRHWIEGIPICIRSCICIEGTFGQRGI